MNTNLSETISVPDGVTVAVQDGTFTVTGPKGTVSRRLFDRHLRYAVAGGKLTVSCANATRREKTILYTMLSHVKNLIQGVTEGHRYSLKVCSGHFPMTVAVKGDTLEVKNFIGEAVPRRLKLNPTVTVAVDGDQLTVEALDVEAAGQQAAAIERLCRRVGFDRRVFQDGIYITHKGEDHV